MNPHGQKSMAGYSPCGHKEWDMTEQLSIAQHGCPGCKLHQLLSIVTPDQHHRPCQPQRLLQLQERKGPRGRLCPDFCSCSISLFLPPAPASSTPHPGYLLSSSAILRDVKEDGAGASLPRHPGLQRHSRGLARVRHSPSTPSLTPSHIHPCLRRTPHLRTLTPLTHARGQWG